MGPTVLSKLTVGPTDLSKPAVGPTVSYQNLLWGPLTLLSKVSVGPTVLSKCTGARGVSYPYLLWGPLTLLSKLTLGPTDCLVQTYCGAHWLSCSNLWGPLSLLSKPTMRPAKSLPLISMQCYRLRKWKHWVVCTFCLHMLHFCRVVTSPYGLM